MAITKWEPFEGLLNLQDRINRLFEETWAPLTRRTEQAWTPAVDIYEDDKEIVVKAELPDIEEKDVEVNIQDSVLTIKGERKKEREEKKGTYHLIETSYGSFSRSFSLPNNVDTDKASAKYEKGVLKITLPKKEGAKPKKIDIKVH